MADLGFDEVTNANLGHDRDGNGSHNGLDHLGVRHTRNTTIAANVSWHALQGHDGTSSSLLQGKGAAFSAVLPREVLRLQQSCSVTNDAALMTQPYLGNASLFSVNHVHDNTTLKHLGKPSLDSNGPYNIRRRRRVRPRVLTGWQWTIASSYLFELLRFVVRQTWLCVENEEITGY